MPKHLVIIWDYYLRYHHDRLRALQRLGRESGWIATGLAAGRGGAVRESHSLAIIPSGLEAPLELGGTDAHLDSSSVAQNFAETLERLSPDVVFVPGYGFRASRAGLRWTRRSGKGSVMMFESQERDFRRVWWKELWKRWLVRSADCAFCGGSHHAAYAEKLGIRANRIFRGYSAVDNDYWKTETESARRQEAPHPTPYILALGRFVSKKNFAGLVEAFSEFKRTDTNRWSLVIAGDGPERTRVEAVIAAKRVTAWVRLPGYVDSSQAAKWLGHASIFVLPSKEAEQWGLVVNEAMAAGIPTVVSEVCGCVPDLADGTNTGLVFNAQDPAQLVDRLKQLTSSADLRTKLASAGEARIQTFSLENFARSGLAAAELAYSLAAQRRSAA